MHPLTEKTVTPSGLETSGFVAGYIAAIRSNHPEIGDAPLAPETLARIIEECAEAAHPRATKRSGQNFWVMRRIGSFPSFPRLTIALNDAGKVVFQ